MIVLSAPSPRWRFRAVVAVLASAAAVAAMTVAVRQPAQAASIDTSAWYRLTARHSGKAMDVAGSSTADGAGLVQQTVSSASTSQQFQFVDSGGGFFRLRARHSGKVVDVSNRSTADGAAVIQWSDLNGTNQQWSVIDTDSGYVKLLNRNSGKALDVSGRSTADGATVVQWADNGGANQQFLLTKLSTPTPTASPTISGTPTTPPAAYPNPGTVTGSTGAHDPSVAKGPNGTYVLAATANNLSLKTSTDRTAWSNAGVVWPNGASWTTAYTGGSANLWAPDISYRNGQFFLYYAASTFGSQHSAIFLATSPTGLQGSWTNQGLIIESSTAVNYNAIDPNLVVDDAGQWWLTFGSFWSGIKMIRLDAATGKRSTSDTAVRALATRTTASGAVEAPFIFKHGGYYYLWVSFDLCCQGAASTYRVMVGRSTSVTGPFTDRAGTAMTSGGGTQVLAGHGSIHGPGHQAVITDVDAEALFYHYYADSGASYLGINLIGYDSAGWPFVY
ncbi:arabinan endo-1,5-alpha-L-arabinosidase [Hamadaea flava]|uniref:Family 43 glycosylhydrolase n=1 Tax=Hamadaea flava TaxID=1742688 RepID=A0ABV8LKP6_9ACTN|nr:family 43 glycosylhydrolase [Hamadaea flava]MCP2323998.1 arabinan endo-1,5-alpha-L-arabinosidase [Hamadaea flava]